MTRQITQYLSWPGALVLVAVIMLVGASFTFAPDSPEIPLALVAVLGAILPGLFKRNDRAALAMMTPMFVATLLCSAACGGSGPPDATRTALDITARTYAAADQILANRYTTAADECREQSDGWPAYDACMSDWDKAVAIERTVRCSLLGLESALDTWQAAADQGPWMEAASCAYISLERWASAAEALDLEIPGLGEARTMVGPWARGTCAMVTGEPVMECSDWLQRLKER